MKTFSDASLTQSKQKIRVDNTSGYKGVTWSKETNQWKSRLQFNGKRICLGYFHKLSQAIQAYDDKMIEFFGEDAITNKKLIESGQIPNLPIDLDREDPPIINLDGELWEDVEGFQGLYQISNKGRIKSLARVTGHGHKWSEKLLSIGDNRGYCTISLHKEDKRYPLKIHRLVAKAFIPNPNNLPQINHKNLNKKDNSIENLEWCDNTYNTRHARANGAFKKKQGYSKITAEQVGEIKRMWATGQYTQAEIAYKYQLKPNSISYIVNNKRWKEVLI